MKTILITGGNGFIGSHLVKGLLDKFRVIVLEKNLQNPTRIVDIVPQIKIYDIDKTSIEQIFNENSINIVIHAATNYGRNAFMSQMVNDNVVFPLRLLEMANAKECELFINLDSFFNKPDNKGYNYLGSYILCKSQLENWLTSFEGKCKVLNVKLEHPYGPNDNPDKFVPAVIRQLLNNETPLNFTPGDQLRDFIHVDDVVAAFAFILTNSDKFPAGFTPISLGTGKQVSIKSFVELAKQLTNSKSELKFGALPHRENEIMSSVSNESMLQRLGWNPSLNIERGLMILISST